MPLMSKSPFVFGKFDKKMCKSPNVKSEQHLDDSEFVIVRVKGMIGKYITADKKIPKESAVCRFCFRKFKENDDNQNALKTHCSCDMTLAHTNCKEDWFRKKGNFNCQHCSQDMKFIPVVILSLSTTPKAENSLSRHPPSQAVTEERKSSLAGSSKATTRGGSIKEGKKRGSCSVRGWFGRWF